MRSYVVLLIGVISTSAIAADRPSGMAFFSRAEDGWFWYEVRPAPMQPVPLPVPQPAPAPEARRSEQTEAAEAEPQAPAPLSAQWFRENLQGYLQRAIDEPTPENVQAFFYLQRIMLDRADRFARMAQRVTMADPFLDAATERPTAPFAASAMNAAAADARRSLLQEIAGSAGILWFFDSRCAVCPRQAAVLKSIAETSRFKLLSVSIDGRPLPGVELADWRSDDGQAARLGVVATPAVFLMRPPDLIRPLGQGGLDLEGLSARIVEQAAAAGIVSEDQLQRTRPSVRPFAVPAPGELPEEVFADPDLLVAAVRERLSITGEFNEPR